MILFKKAADLRKWLDHQSTKGRSAGFVPTMGALHEGHISLINASRERNPVTVCSIFVNPTQFNDPNDFKKYPVTIETDIAMLEAAGCDVLFLPSLEQVYPDGVTATRHYDLGYLETILEGKFRPGHFQGVCQVVHRLLDMVQPSHLYLGQKDYQQCMVIKKLTELIHMDDQVTISICPTLREADGLAMSSRNRRLNKEERETAAMIYRSLQMIKERFRQEEIALLKQEAISVLEMTGFKIDYVEIAAATDLSPVTSWDGNTKLVALVAAFLNEVRLIDNMLLN
jgi:pantoate--beta-alanine ligase